MTRRSATTITVQLTLRVPPGSNAKQVTGFIRGALSEHKPRVIQSEPLAAIDLDSMLVRVTKRETTYL